MLAPVAELSYFYENGSEQVYIAIPEVDQNRWKFVDESAEKEVLSLMSRLVRSYLSKISSSVEKDRQWLQDSMNILLERAADKGALIPTGKKIIFAE